MSLRLVGVNDKTNLRTKPPEIYIVLELEDEDTGQTVELPMGPDAHAILFDSFPDLLAGARNVTPAATSAAIPAARPTPPPAPTETQKVAEAPARHVVIPPDINRITDTVADPAATEVDDFLTDDIGVDSDWDHFEVASGESIVVDPEHGEDD